MKRTLIAVGLGSLLAFGCQNSGQTTTTSTNSTTASTPVTMSTVAPSPDEHAGHGMTPGGTATADPHYAMKMGTKGVEALRGLKGKEFDIAFLSQMIVHHQGAVDMAEDALEVAKEPTTKTEAQKVVDAQKKEIDQMKGWLKEWYATEPSKEHEDLMKQDMSHMMSMKVTDDHTFFDMMIPHHEGALAMSELVEERSEKAELKELAKKMIADQTAEIATYRKLNGGH